VFHGIYILLTTQSTENEKEGSDSANERKVGKYPLNRLLPWS
jgi:hypothetical protein